jgi:hypothetical protein
LSFRPEWFRSFPWTALCARKAQNEPLLQNAGTQATSLKAQHDEYQLIPQPINQQSEDCGHHTSAAETHIFQTHRATPAVAE